MDSFGLAYNKKYTKLNDEFGLTVYAYDISEYIISKKSRPEFIFEEMVSEISFSEPHDRVLITEYNGLPAQPITILMFADGSVYELSDGSNLQVT